MFSKPKLSFKRFIPALLLILIIFFSGIVFYKIIKAEVVTTSVTVTSQGFYCNNGALNSGEDCDGSNLGGRTCLSLGFSGGTLSCKSDCHYNMASCTTNSDLTASSSFSYASGGNYTFSNGSYSTVINMPANYYAQDLTIQMFSYDKSVFESTKPAPSGKDFIGKTYDFVFVDQNGATVSNLSNSATLTISYTDADVSGIDESTLAPYRMGSSDSSWQLIFGATIDTTNNTVTFSTASFSSFAVFGSSSGGGGGGGRGTVSSVTPPVTPSAILVTLQGKAYPSAEITILKDGQIMTTVKADEQANFRVEITNITAGTYTFGVWAEDKSGVRSITFNFTVNVVANQMTTVSGIFIPPTITLDKDVLNQGEILISHGYTAPQSNVEVRVSSDEKIDKIKAASDGKWLYSLDTKILEKGNHIIRAKSETSDGLLSTFSKILSFVVGKKTTEAKQVDINNDGKVNLVDFSILLFNWGVPKNPAVDFNGDGRVDIADFSIMMYWWTG